MKNLDFIKLAFLHNWSLKTDIIVVKENLLGKKHHMQKKIGNKN